MRKRTHEMKIRFTEQELNALTEKASRTMYSREGFCRAVLNGSQVKERPPADVPMLLRQLRQVGYHLNQLCARANAQQLVDTREVRRIVEKIHTAIDAVIDTYTNESEEAQ